jgi:ribulose-5-phosphate 4-epimerase/fuculose-1-phosphate aldolase
VNSQAIAEARAEVRLFCTRLLADGLVYYTAGNISMRVTGSPNLVALTPRDRAYDTMLDEDIVIVDLDGTIVEGALQPTSETPMHLGIYRARPDVKGIVHTHSPAAMAMAILGRRLPAVLGGLVSAAGGAIDVAPYAKSASHEMDELTLPLLEERSVCFLRNHGLLAIGSTVEQAYNAASVVEGAADAYLRALPYNPVELPDDEVERIRNKWKARWPERVTASNEQKGAE